MGKGQHLLCGRESCGKRGRKEEEVQRKVEKATAERVGLVAKQDTVQRCANSKTRTFMPGDESESIEGTLDNEKHCCAG